MTGNVWVALPLACLAVGAVGLYLFARLVTARNELLALLTALVFATGLGTVVPLVGMTRLALKTGSELPAWGHLRPGGAFLRADPGALVLASVALGLGMLVALYSGRYVAPDRRRETYYPLLLLLVAGLVGMVLAGDLFSLYMYCELMSAAVYVLVAFRRHTDTAIEAGFKYLAMGSLGTIIILMGISFVFRETGQLVLPQVTVVTERIGVRGSVDAVTGPWTRAGLACFLVGLGVKSGMAPVHTWLPDAHGRAPGTVSAMLSGVVVQSAFYAMLKVTLGLGFPARILGAWLILLSLLSMTLGNGLALVQTNGKRLLAYSTIAHTGYVMLGVGIGLRHGNPAAIQAGFFLILAHAAMKGLAFLCKGACHFYCNATEIADLQGTAACLPLVTGAFTVALLALAGVPPLVGFTAKWFVLTQALRPQDLLVSFGVVAFLLNGLVSLGYYLPLVRTLFVQKATVSDATSSARSVILVSRWMALPLVILAGIVVAMGVYPGPWLNWVADAGPYLLSMGE